MARIIAEARRDGDAALYCFAQRFDGVSLASLRVSQHEFDAAEAALSETQRHALPIAIDNVRVFHAAQLAKHGGFAMRLEFAGDLHVDEHHTVEDVALALGETRTEVAVDLVFHLLVLLRIRGLSLEDLLAKLAARRR
ncbi:MAG: histidinol dehydrogenase [Gammaproteobacteria bacterium]